MDVDRIGRTREVPVGGGHVCVRVLGFTETTLPDDAPRHAVRFPVVLSRVDRALVQVTSGPVVLGYLSPAWSRTVDFDLWECEQLGVAAVARGVLSGPPGQRDLHVMLAWRRPRR
ncbi:hypothetical protein [Cellulomonas sp.]|uniref:hypothetical protein n=1 Tax=Cellulomonas sp. TaxID=40001 RepID=UPI001B2BAB56|nr:hypothetical protein [Cellulomonas sp.]MBO9554341.1 hypothetical protein [Cellulomonas sp.]